VPLKVKTLGNPIQERLAAHRLLAGAPNDQLAWLSARGQLVKLEAGDVLTARGRREGQVRVILTVDDDPEVLGAARQLKQRGNPVALFLVDKPWDPPAERLYPVLDDLLPDWTAHVWPRTKASGSPERDRLPAAMR
jgi:hypothetical protein